MKNLKAVLPYVAAALVGVVTAVSLAFEIGPTLLPDTGSPKGIEQQVPGVDPVFVEVSVRAQKFASSSPTTVSASTIEDAPR